uniref:Uncharacterized protein n=1 Tax=Trichuris muris TaxID=70415 RepID=A0A5S6R3V6_TRIMR
MFFPFEKQYGKEAQLLVTHVSLFVHLSIGCFSFARPYGGTQVGSPEFGLTAQIENSSDSVPVMFDEYRPACVKFDQVNQCKTSTDDEVGLQSVLRFLPFG